MHYHIILTERCNSHCKYCYEKSMQEFENGLEKKWDFDKNVPFDSEVSVGKLKKFLKPEDTLIFYGGEPLVNFSKMKEIIDNVNCRFCMQTNGKLLGTVDLSYIKKLDKILVSIDGTRERTDENKGAGTYDLVLKNLKQLREKDFSGEIVSRMVVSDFKSDIFEQVKHLLSLGIFDSVHWQLDAGFYKNDFEFEKFSEFADNYNKSILKLIEFWFEKIKEGKVLKLYPFLGILNRLMKWDDETRLPCGSGYANFTITTSGKLSACPIMNSVKNFYCGSIDDGINKEINCSGICKNCNYFEICGGRCLYSNQAQLWPQEGQKLICRTIIFLIENLKKKIPEIEKLISEGIISKKDFEFEKYFGPEIIP